MNPTAPPGCVSGGAVYGWLQAVLFRILIKQTSLATYYMSARDKYHELVRQALQQDGWTITDDPLILEAGRRKVQVDLGAERLLGAEKAGEKIAVEIKSFTGISALQDFYNALGQFNFYQFALERKMPERILYLAVPSDVFEEFFSEDFIESLLKRYQVRMFVYQTSHPKIEAWIA